MDVWRPRVFRHVAVAMALMIPSAFLGVAVAADPSSVTSTALAAIDPQDAHEAQATAEGPPTDSPDLQVRMFSDLNFRTSSRQGSFGIGQMSAFITSRLSDSFSVLSEVALHGEGSGSAGAVGHAEVGNEVHFDLERLLLQYSRSDYFRLAAGRYHTAIGYYNTAYHHGAWFQTAARRPFVFFFEDDGGILPIHSVGLSVSGRIPSGRLGLRYAVEVANGRSSRPPESEGVQNFIDEDKHKAVNLGLLIRPAWAPGLQAGVSVYLDRRAPLDTPPLSETIPAAYVVYRTSKLELLNEAVFIRHAPRSGSEAFQTFGFYSEASRQIARLRPYVRFEYLDADQQDPLVRHVGHRTGPTVGLRFDVGEFVALKGQYSRTSARHRSESGNVHREAVNELAVQLTFTF